MDLFVVNRHTDRDLPPEYAQINEQTNLDRVLKRIERNKKIRSRQKEKLREKVKIIDNENRARQRKREWKAKIIPVPQNESDFIDANATLSDKIDVESTLQQKGISDPSSLQGFTVLGGIDFDKKRKVKRILPKWLSNPTVISRNLQDLRVKVSSLKLLNREFRLKLKANGIKYFFPVQAEVIPWLLKAYGHADIVFPRDVCVSAPTGSGKTLAFVLPIVQALRRHFVRKVRALVVLPTQSLAVQIFGTFQKYTTDTNLAVSLITGQNTFAFEQTQLVSENEAFGYMSKADILVCTAGRLVEHIKSTKGFDLCNLEFLVIDEADRVLENVQNDWLYHLEQHVNLDENSQSVKILNVCTLQRRRPPQKLLFSATLSQDPEKLQMLSLFQPKLFTSATEDEEGARGEVADNDNFIGKYTTPKELTEKYIVCSLDLKPLVLYHFIKTENLTKIMIFTHSIDSIHRLTILLKALFKSERKIQEISSNLETKYRNGLIESFSNGDIDILVCTDSLARGIDLTGVECVISYSAPKHPETYIHRVGRTARAGEPGLAVTILHKSQLNQFRGLLKVANKILKEIVISDEELEPLGEQYRLALNHLKGTIYSEERNNLRKLKFTKRKFTSAQLVGDEASNFKMKRKQSGSKP